MLRLVLLALIGLIFMPLAALAQSLEGFDFSAALVAPTDPFSITVTPPYPAPGESAVLSFVSGGVDLTTATLAVSVAGREIYRGSAKPLAIPLGRAGVPVVVNVRATSGGATETKTVSITPQEVAIVAEPIASTPPLYPGKAEVPLEGKVRLVAIAGLRTSAGAAVDPATASYAWTVDGVAIANGSGVGKTALTVSAPLQYRERIVSVVVTSASGGQVGGASLSFAGSEPTLQLYENDPLLGVRFDRVVAGSYAITGSESSLYAAPYSFPTDQGAPLIQWYLDNSLVQTGSSVTLRPTGSGQGSASLSAVVSSGDFSKATATLSLSFGSQGGFNLFGL